MHIKFICSEKATNFLVTNLYVDFAQILKLRKKQQDKIVEKKTIDWNPFFASCSIQKDSFLIIDIKIVLKFKKKVVFKIISLCQKVKTST